MSRLLLFGASGQIGDFLLPSALQEGHETFAVSRRQRENGAGVHWLQSHFDGDAAALPPFDDVISLGPLDQFSQWFERVRPRVRSVVALSSTSAEFRRDSPDPAERAVAQRLRDSEARLLAAAAAIGARCRVLRPTLIYGAGRDRSLMPLVRLARRTHLFPALPGARGLRQPIHAQDVALACLAALRSTRDGDAVLSIGGAERLAFGAMLARVRRSLGFAALPVPLWIAPLRHLVPASKRGAMERLRRDLVIDNAAALAALDWSPRGFAPQPSDWRER